VVSEIVALRDVVAEDLPTLFRHQLDPAASRMAAFPPRDEAAFIAHWRSILADPSVHKRVVTCGGVVAGYVLCFEAAGERLIGYWIARQQWGKGIATRALQLFLGEEAARPLRARVAKHNLASIRVLEKCGFAMIREERGTLRGEAVDELVFELAGG
jgi:RimJ/RimL family protein N-acetyltransferase